MSDLRSLAKPFKAKYVKKPAPGKFGTYVPHEIVNQKLLAILGPFDMEIMSEIRGLAPEAEAKGKTYPAIENALTGVWLRCTFIIDGRRVSVTEAGDVENPALKDSDGARAKDAVSDALKRCAMRIGCGLELWSGDDYDLYDLLSKSEEAEGTPEVIPPSPSTGTSRPGAAPAPSAPPTHPENRRDATGTHYRYPGGAIDIVGPPDEHAETAVMDRSAKGWVHELVRQYGDERVAQAAKEVAPLLGRKPNSFKSLESWSIDALMIVAEELAKSSDVAGSVSGTDAGDTSRSNEAPVPGTPSPEELLDLIDRAKEAGLIRFSDIPKHSSVFLKAGIEVPQTWGQLRAAPPEALAELVSVLELQERVDPKQGSLT